MHPTFTSQSLCIRFFDFFFWFCPSRGVAIFFFFCIGRGFFRFLACVRRTLFVGFVSLIVSAACECVCNCVCVCMRARACQAHIYRSAAEEPMFSMTVGVKIAYLLIILFIAE